MTVAAELLGGYDIARRDDRGLVVSRDGTVIRMRPGDTVWTPPPLRWVMSALRHVPAPVFRRLPL